MRPEMNPLLQDFRWTPVNWKLTQRLCFMIMIFIIFISIVIIISKLFEFTFYVLFPTCCCLCIGCLKPFIKFSHCIFEFAIEFTLGHLLLSIKNPLMYLFPLASIYPALRYPWLLTITFIFVCKDTCPTHWVLVLWRKLHFSLFSVPLALQFTWSPETKTSASEGSVLPGNNKKGYT